MKRAIPAIILLLLFPLLFSCKTAKLSNAIEKQELGEYYDAAQIYRKVYAKTPGKNRPLRGVVAFNMAECYRKINNTQRALNGYQNAIRYEYADSTSLLLSAIMLQGLGRYPAAIKQYEAFLQKDSSNILAINGIMGCDSASIWKQNPTRYIVKRMDKMNSRQGEFSPMLTGDNSEQLYISSSRKDAIGDEKSGITGNKNNDFFLVKKDEKGTWLTPAVIESEINTEFDEGACSFTSDGATMYYTYCSNDPTAPRTAEIYKSARSGAKWNKGQKVEILKDTVTMTAHPAVSPDGEYLYFVSDMPGGYGGKDIWRVPLDKIGLLYPENLGADINTPGDEMFPYIREDNTLYFASNGHPGMGGLDLFKAIPRKNGSWVVENMKFPINSASDDFGITFAGKEEWGFFSSNRNDARGYDHIYSFELPGTHFFVEGWVIDRDEEVIDNAIVRIVGKDGTNEKIIVRKDGTYRHPVKPGTEYVMMGTAQGYLNQKRSLIVPRQETSETFYVDFDLASISKPVLIENIFYDFDKATLRSESKKALDEMIEMLNDNPNVTIELSAHTDRKGSEVYNQNLSQRRAQSVVDYLIKGGIEKERLTPAGYGKTQPKTIHKNLAKKYDFLPEGQILTESFIITLTPEQQEIADQINRRTEFKVLRTNYRLF